ncbi:MAG: FAD-dependent oxidoreductase [Burkholderiales bacterium]
MKQLLLIGGGHTHVEVIRQIGRNPVSGVEVTLVSPDCMTPYSGMVPGWIAGHYDMADCHIDLERLIGWARVKFVHGTVTGVDPVGKTARLADGRGVKFDIASIDIGSTPPIADVPGAADHAQSVKPVAPFIEWVEGLHAKVAAGDVERIAVVGGGAAGVEVLLAVRHRLVRKRASASVRFCVVTDTPTILPGLNKRARRLFERWYGERDIEIIVGARVTSVSANGITLGDGRTVEAQAVVWATGAAPAHWPTLSGFAVDAKGFIAVDSMLRSTSHPFIFAAGDIASMLDRPYPKSGVYAVRQGPVLAANLRAVLTEGKLTPFVPQKKALALISAGRHYAIAARGRWAFGGRWVWRWKDRIDRKFMRKYQCGDRWV